LDVEPVVGKPLRFPPGRVRVRLGEGHRHAYHRLYRGYESYLSGLPVLRERDFGRDIVLSEDALEALNRGFAALAEPAEEPASPFVAQERGRSRLFKKTQYLS
jgi:hypothetical protein